MLSNKIELLAPVRDLETGRVAVDSGADAVYVGGPGFGARHAAGNSLEDIAELVRYARPFGVRVYATLNTLLFDDELEEARCVAQGLIDAGVDALIVQDMAFLRMGLLQSTSLQTCAIEFHASTQTSNIAPEDVAFLGRAGFRRVILERALSLDEINKIRAATDVELEVFVHGAICVGYSGKCFMSRATDRTRSGNRGNCSQPCRLAYDLVVEENGDRRVLMKGKHLLSVRDLDLSAHIGELLDAGVTSFKIEGRLKDASYVRNIVGHYRALIDRELAARPSLRRASAGVSIHDFTPDPSKSFSRGATNYFLHDRVRGVASFDTPKSMGETIGRVGRTGCDRTGNKWFTLSDGANLSSGDGICFFADGELQGTNINRVEGGSGERIYPNKMDGIEPGVEMYRNYNHLFTRTLEHSRTKRRIGVSAVVDMSASQVSVRFTDETGLSVTVSREGVFDEAKNSEKMLAVLRDELSRSGDTIFEVKEVTVEGKTVRFVPVSMVAAMRREGLQRLWEMRERLVPERHPATEDLKAEFPRTRLTAAENVTNRLAERFYRDHGATEIEPALELRDNLEGATVMRTRYCIRRETGECLREGSDLCGDLYLERGRDRWRLDFDCAKCEMTIINVGFANSGMVCNLDSGCLMSLNPQNPR